MYVTKLKQRCTLCANGEQKENFPNQMSLKTIKEKHFPLIYSYFFALVEACTNKTNNRAPPPLGQ